MKLTIRIWFHDAPAALLQDIRRRIAIEPSHYCLYPHDNSRGACHCEYPHDHPDAAELDRLLATHPNPARVQPGFRMTGRHVAGSHARPTKCPKNPNGFRYS